MATQKYRSRLDKTVGENEAARRKSPGHGQVALPQGRREQNASADKAGDYARSGAVNVVGSSAAAIRATTAASKAMAAQARQSRRASGTSDGRIRRPALIAYSTRSFPAGLPRSTRATIGRRASSTIRRRPCIRQWPSAGSLTVRRAHRFRRKMEIPLRIGMLGAPQC